MSRSNSFAQLRVALSALAWALVGALCALGFVAAGRWLPDPIVWSDLSGWLETVSAEDLVVECARWAGVLIAAYVVTIALLVLLGDLAALVRWNPLARLFHRAARVSAVPYLKRKLVHASTAVSITAGTLTVSAGGGVMAAGPAVEQTVDMPVDQAAIELPEGLSSAAFTGFGISARPVTPSTTSEVAAPQDADRIIVQDGDNLWNLTLYHYGYVDNALVSEVANHNGLTGSLIFPGQMIEFPAIDEVPLPPPVLPSGLATWTVYRTVPGDNLWNVLDTHYGDVDMDLVWHVAGLNQLPDPGDLAIGLDLRLPPRDDLFAAEPETVTETPAPPATDGEPSDIAPVADPEVVPAEAVAPSVAVPVAVPVPSPSADPVSIADDSAAAEPSDAELRPINEWTAPVHALRGNEPVGSAPAAAQESSDEAPELVAATGAAMLASGALMLLGVRRRRQWRAAPRRPLPVSRPVVAADDETIAPPPPAATERALRAIADDERFARVDLAVRAACLSLINHRQRVHAVLAEADGAIELIATGHVALPHPWVGVAERWRLGPEVPIEALAGEARRVAAPTPALVQLGVTGDTHVYVDLEALGALQIDGGPAADAIVAAVAATLATSVLAEVSPLVGVGVPVEAFCGHRLFTEADDAPAALAIAAQAVGSAAQPDTSPFELRARATGGETWEPAVVLVGSGAGEIDLAAPVPRVAVVSAAAILGPSSVLAPDGDAWELRPLGLRLTPVGLLPAEVDAIAELLEVPPIEASEPPLVVVDADDTVVDDEPLGDVALEHSLLVRLIGPVRVESSDGRPVDFERSKTRELVAWLATHRERSTRTLARTALWELDVRDATFANVVSEARRAMARLVEPPEGDEWVGRTMTEDLPLHPLVRTDAEVIEHALAVARGRSARQASRVLRPAVELLSGMPFEGTQYLWPDPEGITSRLVLLATSAAAELAGQCLALGDVEGLFWATDRGLRVLPGHEELIGLRMQAHARVGDHAGIRLEWESYHRTLMLDPWSDGEPSPKLVALRAQLLGNAA